MRSRIGQEAETERQKAQAGYEKTRHQTQERLEKSQRRRLAESGQNDVVEAADEGKGIVFRRDIVKRLKTKG